MQEQLISFETAKLAKEKGYNIPSDLTFKSTGEEYTGTYFSSDPNIFFRPTQSLLQKWLREEHCIFVTALPYRDYEEKVELCFYYSLVQDSEELDDILCNEQNLNASTKNYPSYEEAIEVGLQKALKLIEK